MKGKKNIKHYRPDKDYTMIACNNQPNRKMRYSVIHLRII